MAPSKPELLADGPLEVLSARTLFEGGPARRRSAASVVRLAATGRLLMVFSMVPGPSWAMTRR